MSEGRQGWSWQAKLALAVAVVLVILLFGQRSLRRPWIRPLPGVRVEMTRPIVTEEELGPDSAYRLLLKAAEQAQISSGVSVPQSDDPAVGPFEQPDALEAANEKLHALPWPDAPPLTFAERLAARQKAELLEPPSDQQDEQELRKRILYASAPWTYEQYQIACRLTNLGEETNESVDAALAASICQMPTQFRENGSNVYRETIHPLVRRLNLRAHRLSGEGDQAAAFQDIARMLGIANLVGRGSGLDGFWQAGAWDRETATTARILATTADIPPSVLTKSAREFLAAAEATEPFAETVRADALLNLHAFPHCYAVTEADVRSLASSSSLPVWKRKAIPLLLALAPLAGSSLRSSSRNLHTLSQHLVYLAERPYSREARDSYDRLSPPLFSRPAPAELILRMRDPLGYLTLYQYNLDFNSEHISATLRDTERYAMAIFLAVEAYRKEHGRLPENLDLLVPEYLPRLPSDPFGGGPFHYVRQGVPKLPSDAWAIYSVGEDLEDSGCSAVGSGSESHFISNDLVWASSPFPFCNR